MTMRWLRTRLALATAVSLALGFTATLTVAFALCLWPTRDVGNSFQLMANPLPDGQPPSIWVYSWSNTRSVGFRYVAAWSNPGHADITHHAMRRMREEIVSGRAGLPADQLGALPYVEPEWPDWLPDMPANAPPHTEWGARAAGWPFLCLVSLSAHPTNAPRQTRGSVRVLPATTPTSAMSSAGRDPDRGTIPLRPLLPGLVANTLAFASPVFLGWIALQWLRGAVRRRRGRCTWCGYDRRGFEPTQPCPECGRAA